MDTLGARQSRPLRPASPSYNPRVPERDVALTFLHWTGLRAVCHRGYWLVTSLYLVAEADLSPFQLVFIAWVLWCTSPPQES